MRKTYKGDIMSIFKDTVKALVTISEATIARNNKIDSMSLEIALRGDDIDIMEAKKIAAILVDCAEVNWK
jgi:hypothetical protein